MDDADGDETHRSKAAKDREHVLPGKNTIPFKFCMNDLNDACEGGGGRVDG